MTSFQSQNLHLHQFIEVLCRVAIVAHGNRVQQEGGNLRKAVETTKLDFCLQSLFKYMDFKPNAAERENETSVDAREFLMDENGM